MRVVIEGPDKIGKTTQADLLVGMGAKKVKYPDEDFYSGKVIREILNKALPYEPVSFQALMTLNKIETQHKINQTDGLVIFDRWYQSGIAYGIAEGLDEEWLHRINHLIDSYIKTDIVIILTGTPFVTEDDIYGKVEFQERVKEEYERLADYMIGRQLMPIYHKVDGNQSIMDVHQAIREIIEQHGE